jgi:DNA-binding NtrC family response regulator
MPGLPRRRGVAGNAGGANNAHAARDTPTSGTDPTTMVFADPTSQAMAKLLARIGPSDVPVLISGDVGTGKGAVARHIHDVSGRSGKFVCVNCSAFAEQLEESEVRGERWFESARDGTLFLDEVADLPASLQSQLLGLLQDQEASRAGSRDPEPAEVRLVAATSVDLGETVTAGHFRLELFYRLNVGKVRLLPLRERRGDVAALAAHFLRTYGRRLNLQQPLLSQEAMSVLTQHSWPGNIRELENVIRFALLVSPDREVGADHLKLSGAPAMTRVLGAAHASLAEQDPPTAQAPASQEIPESTASSLGRLLAVMFQTPGNRLLSDLENQIVAEAFRFTGRNQVRTATLLGISRNVLRSLLRKHGLLIIRRRKRRESGGVEL